MSIMPEAPDTTTDTGSCDQEPTHAVCGCQVDATPRLALCGADCSDGPEGMAGSFCVVCVDLIASPCGRCAP